jgi:EC042_2821-lke REase
LEKTINIIASQFEAVRTGESEDACMRVTTNSDRSDVAVAKFNINPEDYYTYTATKLAEKLCLQVHHITNMIRKLGLKDQPEYHKEISTGDKSFTHKYSEDAYLRLKQSIDSSEYYPKPPKIKKVKIGS